MVIVGMLNMIERGSISLAVTLPRFEG